MRREWRELGTTGSTDGEYGESADQLMRKRVSDIAWLAQHWGIDAAAIRSLVGGAIEMGCLGDNLLGELMTHCAAAKPVLDEMGLVHLALASRCATSSADTMRRKRAWMVSVITRHRFAVDAGDQREVKALLDELEAKRKVRPP